MHTIPQHTLRPAQTADAPLLVEVIHVAFAEYVGRLDPPSGAPAETVASLLRLFEQGKQALLATVAGVAVGAVFYVRHGVEMYAHRLAVLPARRGQGIGQALMAWVDEQARAAGCRYVRVAVRLALPDNIAFYARRGYTAIIESSHPGYSMPTFIHMARELDLLRMRNVVVTPYDPAWPAQFAAEAVILRALLGDLAIDIHHVGSTAVPGLAAKPVIDIMPLVRDIHVVDRYLSTMAELGYVPRGEYGLPGRRYCFKDTDGVRAHHVHVYAVDNPEVLRHLAFRDYLRAHANVARQYGELKLALTQAHPRDIEGYMDGKDSFIKEVETRAMRWCRP